MATLFRYYRNGVRVTIAAATRADADARYSAIKRDFARELRAGNALHKSELPKGAIDGAIYAKVAQHPLTVRACEAYEAGYRAGLRRARMPRGLALSHGHKRRDDVRAGFRDARAFLAGR